MRKGIRSIKSASIVPVFDKPAVTIIVPYRHESENLPALIDSLRNQSYPAEKTEIIFVNDNSTDNSESLIYTLGKGLHIKILHLDSGNPSKKEAITLGVSAASGEIILGTDADCVLHKDWIASHVQAYGRNTALVTGPVTYTRGAKMFNTIQELELTGLSLCGAGLIGVNHPVICSGANISYRKDIFHEIGGFASENNLTSGDDELLMHKMFYNSGYKIGFVMTPEMLVKTRPNDSLNSFLQQRRRWASKGPYYRLQTIIMLLPLLIFLAVLILSVPIALIRFDLNTLSGVAGIYLLKSICDYVVLKEGEGIYLPDIQMKDILAAEVLHPLYVVYSVFMGVFFGFSWKDREHKK